jgi:hypothetical protein
MNEEVKTFCDKQKLQEHMTTKPILKIFKVIPHTEKEDKCNQESTEKYKAH